MRTLLISSMRNEGPHLLEWFAHHKRIGFTDFFIAQNDSDDGTREILQVLHDLGEITYHDNSNIWVKKEMRLKHQFQVNYAAAKSKLYQESDWAIMIDGDEFINIHEPNTQITDVIHALDKDAEAIMMYWRNFGSSWHIDMPHGLVTESFTRAEPLENFETEWKLYKTLFKTKSFHRAGIHFPNKPQSENPKILDCSGRLRDDSAHRDDRSIPSGLQKLATINHYRIMDATRFISKHLREQNGKRRKKIGMHYWITGDFNDVENKELAVQSDATRKIMDDLNARSGGALYELSELARKFHQNQLEDALENDPDAKDVFEKVCKHIEKTKPNE